MALRMRPEVRRFVGIARKYCEVLESSSADREAWLDHVLRAVAALYAAAFGMSDLDIEIDDHAFPDNFRMGYEEWATLCNRLGDILGEARYHWAYFDPTEPRESQEAPIIHDLADDLADIYGDIRRGLRAWDTNEEAFVSHALWDWRFSFQCHWGPHAVSAIRALHELAFRRGLAASDTKVDHA